MVTPVNPVTIVYQRKNGKRSCACCRHAILILVPPLPPRNSSQAIISSETRKPFVRSWLQKDCGSRNKRKTHRRRSAWRERRSVYGEMIQFDGSYEYWLEDRGKTGEMCLLAGIDDATRWIIQAVFAEHEGIFPVFGFWQEYLLQNGQPRCIYLDKFSTYNVNHQIAEENSDTLTQFERACVALHLELIKANSPQANRQLFARRTWSLLRNVWTTLFTFTCEVNTLVLRI